MKMHLHLLLAALVIAPVCAYGMDVAKAPAAAPAPQQVAAVPAAQDVQAPVAEPAQPQVAVVPAVQDVPAPEVAPQPQAPAPAADVAAPADKPAEIEAPSASEDGALAAAHSLFNEPEDEPAAVVRAHDDDEFDVPSLEQAPASHVQQNWFFSFFSKVGKKLRAALYPKVTLPVINTERKVKAQRNQHNLTDAIQDEVGKLAQYEHRINVKTKSLHRRLTIALATALPCGGLYAMKCGKSFNAAAAALTLGAFGIMQYAFPELNAWYNRRVLRQHRNGLRTAIEAINAPTTRWEISNDSLKHDLLPGDNNDKKRSLAFKYIDAIIKPEPAAPQPAAAK